MPMCPCWLRIRYMEERTLLNKLERFGAKSTPLLLDELKKNLHTLETSIGPIPESYRAYLLYLIMSIIKCRKSILMHKKLEGCA